MVAQTHFSSLQYSCWVSSFWRRALVVLDLLVLGVGVDQDVVQISKCPRAQHVLQDVINNVLEGEGTVAQTKGHYKAFIVTSRGDKGCLPHVTLSDAHQVVGTAEVNLGESPRRVLRAVLLRGMG